MDIHSARWGAEWHVVCDVVALNGSVAELPQSPPQSVSENETVSPPNIPHAVHMQSLDPWVQAANHALSSAYPKPQRSTVPRYTRVTTLLIQCLEDDLNVRPELRGLQTVLRDVYNYLVLPIFEIPEQGSNASLTAVIEETSIAGSSRPLVYCVLWGSF
jgi:hypothetical protein